MSCAENTVSAMLPFYLWRKKFGGMNETDLKRLRQLEEENRRLKHMYAELSIDHRILKDVVEKKL